MTQSQIQYFLAVAQEMSFSKAAEALTAAIEKGDISKERVDEALWHVLSLKYDKGIL